MASEAPPVPPGMDLNEDRAAELIALTWTWCGISLVFIGMRTYTRLRLKHNFWWDDFLIILTMLLTIGFSVGFTLYATYGGTKHVFALSPETIVQVTKINWVSQVFCIIGIAIGKLSVALLISRLMGPSKWRRITLWVVCTITMAWAVVVVIVIFAQCKPAAALWDHSLGQCYNLEATNKFDIAGASWFAFVDFFLALFPITIILKLQLSLQKRIMLSLLLGLGIFAAICAAIKTSYLPTLTTSTDFTWVTVSLLEWNVNEVNVIIICACIPVIKPLFVKVKEASSRNRATPPQKDSGWTDQSTDSDRTRHSPNVTHIIHHMKNPSSGAKISHDLPRHEHNRNISTASTVGEAYRPPPAPPRETVNNPVMTSHPVDTTRSTTTALRARASAEPMNTTWLDVEASADRENDFSPAPDGKIKKTTQMDVKVEPNHEMTQITDDDYHIDSSIVDYHSGQPMSDYHVGGSTTRETPGRSTLPSHSVLPLSVGEPFGVGELEGDGVGELDSMAVSAEYARHVV